VQVAPASLSAAEEHTVKELLGMTASGTGNFHEIPSWSAA